MKPGKKQEKAKEKEKKWQQKIERELQTKNIDHSSGINQEGQYPLRDNYHNIDISSSAIEQEIPSRKHGHKKSKDLNVTKFNPIQNIHFRYKKFFPLQSNPIENEFETLELIEKLKKSAVEEIKERPKYTLGNYDSYYNYRYEKRWQDPRLKLLKKDFFLNKECLDIGCNEGSLTIMIAIKFFPKKIIGMDIDYKLINKAINNLRYFEKQQALCKTPPSSLNNLNKEKEKVNDVKVPAPQSTPDVDNEKVKLLMDKLKNFPKSFVVNMGIPTNWGHNDVEKNKIIAATTSKAVNQIQEEEKKESEMTIEEPKVNILKSINNTLHIENRFPDNVTFLVENVIKDINTPQKYDTILCLSTTKWIHFNWGDVGIRRLFKKVYDALRPGGYFILEPQDWRSYKKRKYLTKEFKDTYKKIQLRPNNFENYLVQRLGFKLLTKLVPDSENVKTEGFKRPILVFQKNNNNNGAQTEDLTLGE